MDDTEAGSEDASHVTQSPTTRTRRQGASPLTWRHKNKTGLFLISCLGRRTGSFREDPGLPFHHAKPMLPKDGPTARAVRTASILPHCLVLDSRENLNLDGRRRPSDTQHASPQNGSQAFWEGLSWFHKSTCIFNYSFIHSAIIYWHLLGTGLGRHWGHGEKFDPVSGSQGTSAQWWN